MSRIRVPATDAELAQLERRWALTASVVLGVALCGAALVLLVVPLSSEPANGVRLGSGWPPFNHSYNSLEPLISYWWPIGLPVFIVVSIGAIRLLRLARGVLAVGALLLLVTTALALLPIRSYPANKQTPGAGDCNAVLGSGPYGDNDETCYDVRRARRFDVGVLGASGFFLIGLGAAVRIDLNGSRPETERVSAA